MTLPPRPLDDDRVEHEEPKSGMKFSGYAIYAVMVVIALIVSVGINYFMGVSKAELTTNKEEIVALVVSIQSDLRATKDSVKTALDNLPSTIDSRIGNSLNSVDNQLSALEDSVRSANNSANSATNQVSSITAQLTSAKADLESLKASTDLTGALAVLDSALTKITELEASLTALTTKVNGIVAAPTATTTTTTTTTAPSTSGVTVNIIGANPMPLVSGTNTINFVLGNYTTKAIYGEQISIQLQFLNPITPVNTWGLSVLSDSGTFGTPSYSIIGGTVTYIMHAAEYLSPNTTKTVSVVVSAASPPAATINFVTTINVNGYSALP